MAAMRRARKIAGGLALGLGLLIALVGAAVAAYVGPDDTVRSAPARIDTETAAAVVTNELFRFVGPTVHLTVTGHDNAAVFAGVGQAEDVADFLDGTAHEVIRVTSLPFTPKEEVGRGKPGALPPPASAGLWVASIQGKGTQEMIWPSTDGDWRVVLMRANGAEGFDGTVTVAFEMPQLFIGALTAVVSGLAAIVGGFLLLRRRRLEPVELPQQRRPGAEWWDRPAETPFERYSERRQPGDW
ncbi:MAG TPA: hypothetical protein VKG85_00415 [Actinomycetes bacterium]|nr:hypothetical protein [Actinomycetes bacterium]